MRTFIEYILAVAICAVIVFPVLRLDLPKPNNAHQVLQQNQEKQIRKLARMIDWTKVQQLRGR